MEYCKWIPMSEEEKATGKVSIDYTLKTKDNEERIISAYIKDEAGSVVGGTDKITYDDVGPDITFKNTNVKKINDWYQTLTVQINTNDGVGIGIDNVQYCVGAENCTLNKPVNNGIANVVMTTSANAQRIRVLGVDKLGNKNELWASESYKVDTSDPTLALTIGTNTKGDGVWYKALKIKVAGGDVGSGISTIKYCTGESDCTPNKTINNNTENAIPNGAKPQKLCAIVTDKAGRVKTNCTALYSVDGIAPVCGTVKKTVINTTAGVSGTVGCSDTFSGCTNNTFSFSGIKTTNSVQIKDKAGNISKCVQINGRVQKSTNSCYSHSNCHGENVCPTPCKVWSCFDNNVSGNQKYQTGCVTERPSLRCSPVSSGWTDCYWHTWSDNSCSCTGWYGWSNWNDAQSCTPNSNSTTTLVRCQTLYY